MPLVRPPPPPQASSSPNPSTQAKHLPAFANCPHPTFELNLTEWYQITSPVPFPDLDICPDCYNTSIKPVHYSRFISRAPPKPEDLSTRCDFSDLWIRIAYAWLFTTYAPDLSLLGQVASISPDQDGPCPNLNLEDQEVIKGGKPVATRTWYCLADPKGGALIEDLTVCSHCVKHIELILPGLRGIFRPAADGQRVQATCDLMMLGDGKQRCLSYIDQFVSVAEQQRLSGHLDINPLATYIKRWALIPFCKREKAVNGVKRYTMPSTVPEFTVCEECYITHIQPLYSATPPPAILSQISSIMSTQDGFICELYSPRLQQYFKDAVATNDLQGYRGKLVARGQKMQEVKVKLEQMKLQHGQQKAQSELHMQMMLMEQSSAMSMSLANTVGGWYAPTDFRPANAQMNQGSQMAVQAAMTLDNMNLLEREWAEYWE